MMLGKIGVAFSAEEFDISQDLKLVPFLTEAAVIVLVIAGGENYAVCNFKKFPVIATFRAGYSETVLLFVFFHILAVIDYRG